MVLFLLVAEIKGLYTSWRLDLMRHEIQHALWVWFAVACLLVILAFLTKTSELFSRRVIMLWMVLTPVLLVSLRFFVRMVIRDVRRHGRNTRTLAFAGAGSLAQKMSKIVEAAPWLGLRVAGVYDDHVQEGLPAVGLSVRGNLSNLVEDSRTGKVDYVYITLPMHDDKSISQLITSLADTTASVYVVPDYFVFDLLHARWLSMNGIPIVGVFESPFLGVDGWLKRAEDLILGSLILLLIAPLMLLIALGVKLSSPGPIIFKQRRYGLNGQVIDVWKFRSMSVCENGAHVLQATKNDPRVTRFGAFLRATSLDEFPQFINVLQGDMSIVGPRPHAVSHNEQYRRLIYGYMLRHKVKPGITGWAQVNGWRGETDTLEKMQKRVDFDLTYVRNWSLWLDIVIVAKTITAGFSGKNAY
jgi:putative colanic acid biosynthesis UDP-glucose lipid carrier transferase